MANPQEQEKFERSFARVLANEARKWSDPLACVRPMKEYVAYAAAYISFTAPMRRARREMVGEPSTAAYSADKS